MALTLRQERPTRYSGERYLRPLADIALPPGGRIIEPMQSLFEGPQVDPQRGPARLEELSQALATETDQRRRAECMAHIQSEAMQRALDLLVREADVGGFFRGFVQSLVEESESHACSVWLLNDDRSRCELWMADVQGRFFSKDAEGWDTLALPRESMEAHLLAE